MLGLGWIADRRKQSAVSPEGGVMSRVSVGQGLDE